MVTNHLVELMQLVLSFLSMVIHLVIVVLHLMYVLNVVVLQVIESLEELVFELLKMMMVFVFDRLVVFVVLVDAMLALFVDLEQLLFEFVNVALDLFNLLLVRPRSLVPEIVVVHPIMVLEESFARKRAFIYSQMLTVLIKVMTIVSIVLVMVLQAEVNYMNWVVVDEDIDIKYDIVYLEQIVCAQVEVNVVPSTQMRVLNKRQVVLHLDHMELGKSFDFVTVMHLIANLHEDFMHSMISVLL